MTAAPAIHIEPLFATPLVIDHPDEAMVGRAAILEAVAKSGPPVLDALIAHACALATRSTEDVVRRGRTLDWQVTTSIGNWDGNMLPAIEPVWDAFWQAIYVVDDGYGDTRDPGAGGELILADPRLPAPMMEMPTLRLRMQEGNPAAVYAPETLLRPKSGTLLLLPGWVRIAQRPLRDGMRRVMVTVALVAPFDATS